MFEEQAYEQALIISTTEGLMVIAGSSHPGILEIVRRARTLMKQAVYYVPGGFHLAVPGTGNEKYGQ